VSVNSDNNNRRRRVVVVTGSGKGIGKAIANSIRRTVSVVVPSQPSLSVKFLF
jgi:NAD(P)-dependent dehydrogenase (short-subunit alcohol dehydrogenase family)